jgi:hypothetical protein
MLLLKDLGTFHKQGTSKRRHWYLCECSYCGNSKELLKQNMERDKSCGCATHLKAQTSHNKSRTREYQIWADMKDRCNNTNNPRYHRYGGRGITYPSEWESFEVFWADMQETYQDTLTLDRINNDQGYSKNNCEWKTLHEQFQNRSSTKIVSHSIDHLLEPLHSLDGKKRVEEMYALATTYNVTIATIRTHYNKMKIIKGLI